jgi:hypothetical protein
MVGPRSVAKTRPERKRADPLRPRGLWGAPPRMARGHVGGCYTVHGLDDSMYAAP